MSQQFDKRYDEMNARERDLAINRFHYTKDDTAWIRFDMPAEVLTQAQPEEASPLPAVIAGPEDLPDETSPALPLLLPAPAPAPGPEDEEPAATAPPIEAETETGEV